MDSSYNKKSLTEKRKQLRSNGTSAEAVLWNRLKEKQLDGRRFRRQFSINNYIVDFYCTTEKLAIELDGQNHFTQAGSANDYERDQNLKAQGVTVLRFENEVVFKNIEGVLDEIKRHFKKQVIT